MPRRGNLAPSRGYWAVVILLTGCVVYSGLEHARLREEVNRLTVLEQAQTQRVGMLPDLLRTATELYTAGFPQLVARVPRSEAVREASAQCEERLVQMHSNLSDAGEREKLADFWQLYAICGPRRRMVPRSSAFRVPSGTTSLPSGPLTAIESVANAVAA
jgi:hypothetical protein